eukprot:1935948-Amphidinium_carterae.1
MPSIASSKTTRASATTSITSTTQFTTTQARRAGSSTSSTSTPPSTPVSTSTSTTLSSSFPHSLFEQHINILNIDLNSNTLFSEPKFIHTCQLVFATVRDDFNSLL